MGFTSIVRTKHFFSFLCLGIKTLSFHCEGIPSFGHISSVIYWIDICSALLSLLRHSVGIVFFTGYFVVFTLTNVFPIYCWSFNYGFGWIVGKLVLYDMTKQLTNCRSAYSRCLLLHFRLLQCYLFRGRIILPFCFLCVSLPFRECSVRGFFCVFLVVVLVFVLASLYCWIGWSVRVCNTCRRAIFQTFSYFSQSLTKQFFLFISFYYARCYLWLEIKIFYLFFNVPSTFSIFYIKLNVISRASWNSFL